MANSDLERDVTIVAENQNFSAVKSQVETKESSKLVKLAKKSLATLALAGTLTGGVAACAKFLDDGVPNCGDVIEPELSTTPNARLDIDGEHYAINVYKLAGDPMLTITKGHFYHEYTQNDPVMIRLAEEGDKYVGSAVPEGSSEELHVSTTADIEKIETSCS